MLEHRSRQRRHRFRLASGFSTPCSLGSATHCFSAYTERPLGFIYRCGLLRKLSQVVASEGVDVNLLLDPRQEVLFLLHTELARTARLVAATVAAVGVFDFVVVFLLLFEFSLHSSAGEVAGLSAADSF